MSADSIGSGAQVGSEIGRPRLLQRAHEAISGAALQLPHRGTVHSMD
jgi:hypothetical protein